MTGLPSAGGRYWPALALLPLFLVAAKEGSIPDWKEQSVIFLDDSPNARQHPVPVQAVRVGEGFWSQRRRVVTERSLPSLLLLLEEHGVVDNFRRLAGRPELPRRGPLYTDSDLYKWVEAASWALASNETSDGARLELKGDVESLIGHIIAAQEPSGYLNTYYTGDKIHLRFTELTRSHEDYCLGHLLQAGIAYYRATGNRRLLDAGIRFADYIVDNFGPSKRPFVTGHPELEMALVELYRTTRQPKYLDFARYLLSGVERERLKLKDSDIHYIFSGKPFTSHTEFEGHAVRALYAASGATDYFTETGDPAYKKTLDLLWTDLTMRKMYITGGVGSRSGGESFGDPYELPSEQAYAETCAAIANVMWNYRLLTLTGDARYADLLERALYNGVNSGLSLSGNMYCYRNPLASTGDKLRNPWYDTTCCPPNIQRLFESLPAYLYSSSREGVYLNLYHNSELDWHLDDGTALKLTQSTNYPWTGDVHLAVNPAHLANFTIYLRWPEWASSVDVQVNGQPISVPAVEKGSFVPITRSWHAGDSVSLSLPLQAVLMAANPRLTDDYGRVAVQRGPLVYALEQLDQNGTSIADVFLKGNTSFTVEYRKDFLGGIAALKAPGFATEKSMGDEPLYQPFTGATRPKHALNLTFIPYYAIGNREPTPMEVWVPISRSEAIVSSVSSLGTEKHSENR
jgi:uncharacterized protein